MKGTCPARDEVRGSRKKRGSALRLNKNWGESPSHSQGNVKRKEFHSREGEREGKVHTGNSLFIYITVLSRHTQVSAETRGK